MRVRLLPLVFLAFSGLDLMTTVLGTKMGYAEANPILAKTLNDLGSFVIGYLAYSLLGAGVVYLSLVLSKISRGFTYLSVGIVVLKALPVVNNVIVLSGVSWSNMALTTVKPVLENLFMFP